MQTAREFLVHTFGESANLIEDINAFGNTTISGASLVIAQTEAGVKYAAYVSCGGKAIMRLERNHSVDKRPMYVVLDYTDAQRARAARERATRKSKEDRDNMTNDDWAAFHKPEPHPVMRLVQSA